MGTSPSTEGDLMRSGRPGRTRVWLFLKKFVSKGGGVAYFLVTCKIEFQATKYDSCPQFKLMLIYKTLEPPIIPL